MNESEEALALLRAKLCGDRYPEGAGRVVFTRIDGRTVEVDNVRTDSIGPGAENKGVVGVEFFGSNRVVHIPFVESWEVYYD